MVRNKQREKVSKKNYLKVMGNDRKGIKKPIFH